MNYNDNYDSSRDDGNLNKAYSIQDNESILCYA